MGGATVPDITSFDDGIHEFLEAPGGSASIVEI